MKFGYGRVSRFEQNLDLQVHAFIAEGIDQKNIYLDKDSRAKEGREGLNKVIELLREGDVLYVWKLDRIVGSIIQLDKVLKRLEEKDASLRIITQPFIDTSKENPFSKFVRNMFALLSEFERDTIIERTKAGLASAKQRGKILGAPRGISDKNKKKGKLVAAYFKEGKLSVNEVCDLVGVSRGTYYKYLEIEGLKGAVRSYKKN
jgi:DNA invertase Pin-like site-specific DNA recombinase